MIKRRLDYFFIRQWYPKPVSECDQRFVSHFLLLVGRILTFAGFAHAITLHRFRKNHSRLALVRNGSSVCGIYLVWIVSTSIESPYVFIGHVGNHRGQFGVLAKESFADKRTVFRLKCLIFAVNRFFHPLFQ